MAKKFLKFLTNNLGFKLLALFFAVVLWLVVYNIDDPMKTKNFSTNVIVENADTVTNMDRYYEILDGSGNITFSVSAKRSVMDKLTNSDFTAIADMNNIVISDDGASATVEIRINCNRSDSSIKYNGKSKQLKLALEDLMSKQYVIAAKASGSVADGYALSNVDIVGSNLIKVSGPASVVETISGAVATINVDGVSTSVSDNVIPVLYDTAGNEVDTSRLTLSVNTVTINAAVQNTKDAKVIFNTTGTPASDYRVMSIETDQETVRVRGTTSALNKLKTIDIPASLLDVSGISESFTTTIDITEYLPEGIVLVDSKQAVIKVSVNVEAYKTQTFDVPTANITVEGLAEDSEIAYDSSTVKVTVGAIESKLASLSANDIMLTLNASGFSSGTHNSAVKLAGNNDYDLVSGNVEFVINKKSVTMEAPSDEPDENDEQNDN